MRGSNIIPFSRQAHTSATKENQRDIAYAAHCIETLLDLLESNQARTQNEKSAYILIRREANNILRIIGGNQ